MQIILENVWSRVELGDTAEEAWFEAQIQRATSYRKAGAHFSYAYQNGSWDGMIRLGFKRKKTLFVPTGLIPQILSCIDTRYFSTQIADQRIKPVAQLNPLRSLPGGVTLRDYQNEMIETLLQEASIYRLSTDKTRFFYNNVGNKTAYRVSGYGIWWAATGSGKTKAAAGLIGRLAVPTIFAVYGSSLVLQTWNVFNEVLGEWLSQIDEKVGLALEGELTPGYVTVASVNTLLSWLEKPAKLNKKFEAEIKQLEAYVRTHIESTSVYSFLQHILAMRQYLHARDESVFFTALSALQSKLGTFPRFDFFAGFHKKCEEAQIQREQLLSLFNSTGLFIVDEVHQAASDTIYTISQACPSYYKLGLSGTPLDRSDNTNLKVVAALGEVIYRVSNAQMVEGGYVPRAHIYFVPIRNIPSKQKSIQSTETTEKQTRWMQSYLTGIVYNEERNAIVMNLVSRAKARGKRVLVLFRFTDHGENLAELARDVPHLKYALLTGASALEERTDALKQLASGELDVILASDIFQQGIDLPEVDVLINAAGGKGVIPILQRLGRGLRGKSLDLYDFADSADKYLARHALARLTIYRKEGCFLLQSYEPDENNGATNG